MTKKRQNGFTIVELVVVIAVVAILAAVLIPTFSGLVDRAHDSAAKQNARNAYMQYVSDHPVGTGQSTMLIYDGGGGRYVVIKDGVVDETVYDTLEAAKAALVTDGTASNYTILTLDGALQGLYLSGSLESFADPTINVSMSQTAGETSDPLAFALYHGTLSLGSISVPQSAVAAGAESVNVTIKSANPADTVEMGEHTKAYGYDIEVSNLAEGQSVEVTLNAPVGLPAVKVYHSGEDITDSVTYDERSGAITFETDSFSPYIVAYEEYEVSTVEELREAVAIDGAYIKLTADITANMNKSVEGNYCDEAHSWYSESYSSENPECRYYHLALITGVDVSIDLNGHTIEVIEQLEDGYCYCASTFTVGKNANLNILDSVGDGKIKLNGPVFAVWAQWPENTSTDIYGGIFMSDTYVGDDIGWHTPQDNQIIYAGYDNKTAGSINIYGGYFMYNNTPNDDKNTHNGAFNVGDKATVPCIYIHDGVMLINQYYRQGTGTDDDSILLADGCEIVKVTLDTPIVIDGVSYATWYQVQTQAPKFETVFENTDSYMYRVGNANAIKLGSLFEAVSPNSAINANAKIDVTIEALDASTNVQGTYTAASSAADWANATIKFTGTGAVKVTINGCELLLEVVDGKNVTAASELNSSSNNILLNDITISSGGAFDVGSKTLFGNGFTFDIRGGTHAAQRQGVISLSGGTLDNIRIIGDVFKDYAETFSDEYYLSAVACLSGECTIVNSYISGCHSAVRLNGATLLIDNTTLYGGRLSNLEIVGGNVTLRDVTTINEKQTVDGTTVLGFGVFVYDYSTGAKITVEGDLTQYNWASKDDKDYLPSSASKYMDTAFGYTQFVYTYNGTDYVNLGIISISGNVLSDSIDTPNGYSAQNVGSNACVVTCDSTIDGTKLDNGIPVYAGWSATAQGAVKPTFTWTYPSDYLAQSNTITATFEQGNSYVLNPNFLVAKKHGITLPLKVTIDGVDYTGKEITFTESGNHTIEFVVTDGYNYTVDGSTTSATYTFTVNVVATASKPDVAHTAFTYTDFGTGKLIEINGKYYIMPDVSATSSTITSTTVDGETVYMPIVEVRNKKGSGQYDLYAPAFSWITITDPDGTAYNKSSSSLPSNFGYTIGEPYCDGTSNRTTTTYGDYGVCYYSYRKTENYSEHNKIVCFYYTDSEGRTYNYYVQYHFPSSTNEDGCITPDTLITLADGTQKRVDELTGNELLLVWNMETGKLDSAPIMFIDTDASQMFKVIRLTFSDGTEVKVISEHGFWDYDLNRYVYLDENAADYIGHTFAKQNGDALGRVQLVDVVIENEYTMAYSPVTAGHLCYFVNGMLSMPGGVGGLFNIFDVNAETMSYDLDAIEKDIETYGLFTYEELNAIAPLSREMFEAAGGQYLKISIGKGNLTMDELVNMINRYSKFI